VKLGLNLGSRLAQIRWLRLHRTARLRHGQSRPHLFVDVSNIYRHDARTGIQRVVRSIWGELRRRSGSTFDLVPVVASARHGYCAAPLDCLDGGPAAALQPIEVAPGDHFLGLDLTAHLLPRYREQLRCWQRQGVSVHLIVYDLLPLLRPQWFQRRSIANYARWFDTLTSYAESAICISRQVAREFVEELYSRGCKRDLAVVHLPMAAELAASNPSTGVDAATTAVLNRSRFRPAVLMVGTVEARKGYEVALAAFDHLWQTGQADAPDLVIVGRPGWKTEKLQQRLRGHVEQGRRLHWIENASDEALGLLYHNCRGVLMASRGEGFGLPLTEAVLHGRPVLARDLAVFREQDLPGVSYFQSDSPEPLARAIMELARTGLSKPMRIPLLPGWDASVDKLLAHLGLSDRHVAPPEASFRAAL
jgi:glycosyltransferase involved in cell wall biosynthesis